MTQRSLDNCFFNQENHSFKAQCQTKRIKSTQWSGYSLWSSSMLGLYWSNLFKSKLPAKGYSKLEIHLKGELGLGEPPAFSGLSPAPKPLLSLSIQQLCPVKWTELLDAESVYSLNTMTLLLAYQAEILEEMGRQVDTGSHHLIL